jgi:hypothetical protein
VEVSALAEAEEVTPSGASGSGRDRQRRRTLFGERVAGERLKKMKKRIDSWCRLLGTNSLKEGTV